MVERAAFAGGLMEDSGEFYLTEEAMEWVGLKKSEYLSLLIQNQRPGDYDFADFTRFDHLIRTTIETPDKTFELPGESYPLRTFTRTYEEEGESFHHLIIGALCPDEKNEVRVLVPVLAFVTKSADVAKLFLRGELLRSPTLN